MKRKEPDYKHIPVTPELHRRIAVLKAQKGFRNCDEIIAPALDLKWGKEK